MAPQESSYLRTPLSSYLVASILFVLGCEFGCLFASGQDKSEPAVEGYITAVRGPNDFDVNGTRVWTSPAARYGIIGGKAATNSEVVHGALMPGTYVQIAGDVTDKGVNASEALIAGDWNRQIEGFGVIDRVITDGPAPIFQADGYRIRIASTTVTKFASGLKTLADVGTNTWLRYAGRRGPGGVLLATQVTFIKARQFKVKPPEPDPLPTEPSLIDSRGKLVSARTKVRFGDAGGWCGWHKVVMDQAMQERVRRVGMKVIPEYQKQLPDDSPSKIHFRIYVVDDPVFREDLECVEGLILVPRQVVERLASDDQLAAIMANGVAYSIEAQSARLRTEILEIEGAEFAGDVVGGFVPGVNVGTVVGGLVANHEIEKRMREQAGRIALTLMADAGFDPRQAPEAWRLLAPKKLPKDLASLKYPSRAGYQMGILRLETEPPQASPPAQ
jgi:hypothetical protein